MSAPVLGPAALAAHWIHVEREWHRDALVGPYATRDDAGHAMDNALLIDALCDEDAVEVYLRHGVPADEAATLDVHIIDPTDYHHTGRRAACIACGGPAHNPTWGCTTPRTA